MYYIKEIKRWDKDNMKTGRKITRPVFVRLLLEWRKVLVLCIALGILLGGARLLIGIFSWNDKMDQFQADMQIYNQDLDECEATLSSLEDEYNASLEKINQQEEYLQNSILMNMNPEQENRVLADVWINLDDSTWRDRYGNTNTDPADTLVELYNTYLNHQMDWSKIATASGIKEEYIGELVQTIKRMDSNILTIRVSHPDPSIARTILDAILNEMTNYKSQLDSTVGPHSIVIANIIIETISDQSLAESQSEQKGLLSTYKQEVVDTQNRIDEISWPIWPTSEPSRKAICISSALFGILGIVLGWLICYIYLYLRYYFDGKIHSVGDMEDLLNIPCLGVMLQKTEFSDRGNKFLFVDRQVVKIVRKILGEKFSIEDNMRVQMLALNIKNYTDNIGTLLLVGNVEKTEMDRIKQILDTSLQNLTIMVTEGNDIYQKISEYEGILLIEQLNYSNISEAYKIKEITKAMEKTIIGFVLV